MRLSKKTLLLNGAEKMFIYDPAKDSLADVLRKLGLTGTKIGCNIGVCGSCSVILDGKVVRSCSKKMDKIADYSEVVTIEGIGTPLHPHPLQVAFAHLGAVQCGFCTPGFIVSAYALLKENPSPSREQVRAWFKKHSNYCRCTGYKQIVDAVMAAARVLRGECRVEDIMVKLPEDREYYGKELVRPSAMAKACGVADYGDDIALKMPDGTLHVAIIQPRITHHAKILSIDFSAAEKVPGVVRFITAKDVQGTNRLSLFVGHQRSTVTKPTCMIISDDTIYRWGDVVGLVVADTKEHAREAAAKVKVNIEELPAYLNYLDAAMPDARRIHDDTPNIYCYQPVLKGRHQQLPELIDSAAYAVEGSFYSSREPHLTIEGDTVQSYYDKDGILVIHCKSQGLYGTLYNVSEAVGVDMEQMRMIENPTGSSFGWAMYAGSYALCAIATIATGMPCALSMSYEEHQHYSGKRCPSYSNGRLACDAQGKIVAAEFDCALDHGPYSDLGDDLTTRPARFMYFPYYIPNVAGLVRVANTNHSFGIAYRGYGSPQAYTMSEAMIDMLAEKAGIDPFEFRWRNIARSGETNINNRPFAQYPMEELMLKMKPYYEQAVARAKAEDSPELRRGVGLAWGGYNVTEGPSDACTVALELGADGKFIKYDTWQDQGQGGDIGSLMVTLEALKELQVTPEQIRLVQNDTGLCPDHGFSASSRSHYMNGLAVSQAADKLIAAMRKPDGSYRSYQEMVDEGIPTKYEATYENVSFDGLVYLDPNTGEGNPTPAYTYALFMAEVAVETATGKTHVIGYTCIDDVGVIGNRAAVNGQAIGGISHSIGFALSENYEDVRKHNNIVSSGIPSITDIPDNIVIEHCENPRPDGPWGSSGASEAFQSSGHMAVINAIKNACGVRIYELPATPDKVKAGLEALAQGQTYQPQPYFLGSDLYEELENIKNNPITE
ncbi:MAG: molybdopterin-dependent oxidoreductase [Bacillota bacterium]|nr:molybdopterin-dependent oxidoreductase [Bacillota bacterium]